MNEDLALQPLHPNVRTVWIIGDLIFTGVVAVGATVGLAIALEGFLIALLAGVVIGVGFGWFLVRFSHRQYDAAGYACREQDVVVCTGVWWKKRVCVPRLRVQHVDIESGPIERKFGLCHLSIYTAGKASETAKIEGLSPEMAEALRAELIGEKKNAERSDSSVPSLPEGEPGG